MYQLNIVLRSLCDGGIAEINCNIHVAWESFWEKCEVGELMTFLKNIRELFDDI